MLLPQPPQWQDGSGMSHHTCPLSFQACTLPHSLLRIISIQSWVYRKQVVLMTRNQEKAALKSFMSSISLFFEMGLSMYPRLAWNSEIHLPLGLKVCITPAIQHLLNQDNTLFSKQRMNMWPYLSIIALWNDSCWLHNPHIYSSFQVRWGVGINMHYLKYAQYERQNSITLKGNVKSQEPFIVWITVHKIPGRGVLKEVMAEFHCYLPIGPLSSKHVYIYAL